MFFIVAQVLLIGWPSYAMNYDENSRQSTNVEDSRGSHADRCEKFFAAAEQSYSRFINDDYQPTVDTSGGYTLTVASSQAGIARSTNRLNNNYHSARNDMIQAHRECATASYYYDKSRSYDPSAIARYEAVRSRMDQLLDIQDKMIKKKFEAEASLGEFKRGLANIGDHTK